MLGYAILDYAVYFLGSQHLLVPRFLESVLPRQSILGLGQLGREAILHVTSTKVNFETNFQKSQTTNLY